MGILEASLGPPLIFGPTLLGYCPSIRGDPLEWAFPL